MSGPLRESISWQIFPGADHAFSHKPVCAVHMRHKTSQRDRQVNTGNWEGEVGEPVFLEKHDTSKRKGKCGHLCSGGAGPKSNMWMASLNKERHIYCPSCLGDLGWADLFGFPFTNEVQYALKKIMWINWKEIAWPVRNSQNSNCLQWTFLLTVLSHQNILE